jgi:diacylglycerol O-acyltransferase / wax synthase
VERLTGQDASFLYNETPTQHLHTLKVAIVDPSTLPGGFSFPGVRAELEQRLHLLPPFRRRIVTVPLHLSHPVWIEDAGFDLNRHLKHTTLPPPADGAALDTLISRIAGEPLDRDRPLWQVWVVEGLADGKVAFVVKIHHCAADGVMAAELLTQVFEIDRNRVAPPAPERPWRPEPRPTRAELLGLALRDSARRVVELPGLLLRTLRALYALLRHRRSRAPRPAAPFAGAKTSFNGALSADRTFAATTISLSRVKAIKAAFEVTVNDVILALCTGALRGYLDDRGELPTKPLVAGVPISTRTQGSPLRANSVSNLFVSLPVHVDDVETRMATIHDSTRGAKHVHNLLGVDLLADWSEFTPGRPYSAVVRWYSRKNLADKGPPPINVIISNVPGPREPLYIAGAELTAIYSMGPILEGVGLNITLWSYRDELFVGAVSCPQLVPDLAGLVARLDDALAELEKAVPCRRQSQR